MNARFFFILYSLLLVWIMFSHVYMLLYYWVALLLIAIFLHTRPQYKTYQHKLTNAFMFLFVLFIVWERTRHYKFGAFTELVVNDAEHILFALLICLIINFIAALKKGPSFSFGQKLLLTVVVFNITGVLNELFQNIIGHRTVFALTADSQKDIWMNMLGTAVFVLLMFGFAKRERRPEAVTTL